MVIFSLGGEGTLRLEEHVDVYVTSDGKPVFLVKPGMTLNFFADGCQLLACNSPSNDVTYMGATQVVVLLGMSASSKLTFTATCGKVEVQVDVYLKLNN